MKGWFGILLVIVSTNIYAGEDYLGKYMCPVSSNSYYLVNYSDYGTRNVSSSETGRDIALIKSTGRSFNWGPFEVVSKDYSSGYQWKFSNKKGKEVAKIVIDQKLSTMVLKVNSELDPTITEVGEFNCFFIERDFITQD